MRNTRRTAGWRAAVGLVAALAIALEVNARTETMASVASGRAIFRTGARSNGGELAARTGEAGVALPAKFGACVQCHGYDARGRSEAGVDPSDIRGETLGKPYAFAAASGRKRPPYDLQTFFEALTRGVDSGGRTLDPAMPRFALTIGDAADLLVFLQQIANEPAPGVTDDAIRIGLVSAAETSAIDARLLEAYFASDVRGGIFRRQLVVVAVEPGAAAAADVLGVLDGREHASRAEPASPAASVPWLRVTGAGPETARAGWVFSIYPDFAAALSSSAANVDGRAHHRRLVGGGLVGERETARQVALLAAASAAVEALRNSGRELGREKFVTSLEALRDFRADFAPPLTFTPNRRVAVGAP